MFYREKRFSVGNYQEADIFPMTDEALKTARRDRTKDKKRKVKVTKPAQQNLNDKNSRRYMRLKVQGCFGKGDLYGTLTYNKAHMPKNVKEANKQIENYIARLRYKAKKDKKVLKYLYITEFVEDEETGKIKNIHHHILIGKELSMDDVVQAWYSGRGKNRKKIGINKWDTIDPDSDGLLALANYFSKQKRWKKGKRRWSCSQNLEIPIKQKNDSKYRRRKIEQCARSNDYGVEYFREKYPNYHITYIEPAYYEETGWHFHLRMWKKERG
ncbi:hypothetical protein JZO78_04450 [Enterococcus ureilyticus]|uniref:rolling circle replication-associated protein n=1 Tax=Enterococcus ureilyticus TaxID=1131292 RepID=UPI001A928E6C|nr:hypothetical protein [Enterococcus ureilyticus]MBO0445586.1 hypothetical protein [Enterococcus ureilyticus]